MELPPPPYPGKLANVLPSADTAVPSLAINVEDNRLPVELNPPAMFDNTFDYFVSSSSSSSSTSEYGSMSFNESYADFGDLLSFLDDVFME